MTSVCCTQIIVSWNGLAISAFARASRILRSEPADVSYRFPVDGCDVGASWVCSHHPFDDVKLKVLGTIVVPIDEASIMLCYCASEGSESHSSLYTLLIVSGRVAIVARAFRVSGIKEAVSALAVCASPGAIAYQLRACHTDA